MFSNKKNIRGCDQITNHGINNKAIHFEIKITLFRLVLPPLLQGLR